MTTVTTIKVHCRYCSAESDLAPESVTLHLWSPGHEHRNAYTFRCPGCEQYVTKPVPPELLVQMLAVGAEHVHTVVPKEADEPHHGPPINYDDVLDAMRDLQGDPLNELKTP